MERHDSHLHFSRPERRVERIEPVLGTQEILECLRGHNIRRVSRFSPSRPSERNLAIRSSGRSHFNPEGPKQEQPVTIEKPAEEKAAVEKPAEKDDPSTPFLLAAEEAKRRDDDAEAFENFSKALDPGKRDPRKRWK